MGITNQTEDFVQEYLRKKAIPLATPEELELAKVWLGKLGMEETDNFFYGFVSQEYREFCYSKFIEPDTLPKKHTLIEVFEFIYQKGRESGCNDN